MPYFDLLFSKFAHGDAKYLEAYGKHVHWGYWSDLNRVSTTAGAYAEAEAALSRLIYEGAGVRDGMTVLDVGCGFGGTVAMLNDAYNGVRLTGLNIDARQLDRARGWVKARPGNTVDFVEADAGELPFPDASIDAMTAVECIFHFRSRLAFLREARRTLKPGGWLAISDFVPAGLFIPFLGIYALLVRGKVSKIYGNSNGAVTITLYRFLAKWAGFRRIEILDITRNTLPTFTALKALTTDRDPADEVLKAANRPVEFVSRLGLLRYLVVRFQK